MTKKHFIALADVLRNVKPSRESDGTIIGDALAQACLLQWRADVAAVANFCQSQNPFNRDRWLAYIAGECGPNGGKHVEQRDKAI